MKHQTITLHFERPTADEIFLHILKTNRTDHFLDLFYKCTFVSLVFLRKAEIGLTSFPPGMFSSN